MSHFITNESAGTRLEKAWHLHSNIVILVKAGNWDAIEKRLNTKKVPRDKSAKRLLHSVRQRDFKLLMEPDDRGRLPIHWACTRGESLKRKALKALIDAQPKSIRHRDLEGSTPLHILFCGCLKSTELSKLLIHSYPEALTVRDVFGRTPMFHLVHSHLASYVNDEDFPARRLIPALENLLSKGQCVDALTLPCGPIGEYRSPAEATYVGPSHSFPNLWQAPPMQRTPLYMMWHYAINANTPLWRSGKKAKVNKKKMRVALFFLRCVYLKEVNGSFDFDMRRKKKMLRQLVKQAKAKSSSMMPSSDVESLDSGLKSRRSIQLASQQKHGEKIGGNIDMLSDDENFTQDSKSAGISDEDFSIPSPMNFARLPIGTTIMGEDFFGSSRQSVMSRISIPLSEFDDIGTTDDEQQNQSGRVPKNAQMAGVEGQAKMAQEKVTRHKERQGNKSVYRVKSADSVSEDSIEDAGHPQQNFSLQQQQSQSQSQLQRNPFGLRRRKQKSVGSLAEPKSIASDSKNSPDFSELEDHSFFEWMSSLKRRSNKQLVDQTKFRLTHATITFHPLLPTSEILDMALKYCPYQLVKREAKSGYIPLHLAIMKNAGYCTIKRLLDTNPLSARIRTTEGQLPLHLALSQTECDPETINCIFQAYPDAIKEKDPLSLLYPFMIPASLNRNKSSRSIPQTREDPLKSSNDNKDDVKALTQSYQLLMLNPHIAEI